MRKAFRIFLRIIILPFIIIWDFSYRDIIYSWKAIWGWIIIDSINEHSAKAEHDNLVDIYSKLKP